MKRALQLYRFGEEDFEADEFIKSEFDADAQNATNIFADTLNELKTSATSDLQKNVYRNYQDFSHVSKEISQIENDMVFMKNLMSDLRHVHENLKQLMPAGEEYQQDVNINMDIFNRKNSTRSQAESMDPLNHNQTTFYDAFGKKYKSIGDLNVARKLQIKDLYEEIEGLGKIMPLIGTRYLLKDGEKLRFTEKKKANGTTAGQSGVLLMLYLFNDCLVVVQKKKSMLTGKIKLIAERMLKWSDITLVDLKDIDNVNLIKIIKQSEHFVYKAEYFEDKRLLLKVVKKVTDEMAAEKLKDKKEEQPAQANAPIGFFPGGQKQFEGPSRRGAIDLAKAPKITEKEQRYLAELPDDLDVLIVHRDFEQAVASIERAEKIFQQYPGDGLSFKLEIDARKQKLANLLSLQLANPDVHRREVKWNIDRLLRMGLGEQARDIFLTARSLTISHRIRQLVFVGDVSLYIRDLSQVVFRMIRNTSNWYGASFREAQMASGFIQWVQDEIGNYAHIFRKQVFDANQTFQIISVCCSHTMSQCMQLKAVGLDMSFVLDKLFLSDLCAAVDIYTANLRSQIMKAFDKDDWKPVSCTHLQTISLPNAEGAGHLSVSQNALNNSVKIGNGSSLTSLSGNLSQSTGEFSCQSVPGSRNQNDVRVGDTTSLEQLWLENFEFNVQLSKSTFELFAVVADFCLNIRFLISIPLYNKIVQTLNSLFELYFQQTLKTSSLPTLNNRQHFTLMESTWFVCHVFMPWISSPQSLIHFNRSTPELEDSLHSMQEQMELITAAFISSAKTKLSKVYPFHIINYTNNSVLKNDAKATEEMARLLNKLDEIATELPSKLNKHLILSNLISGIVDSMGQDKCWHVDGKPRVFGCGGIEQFILDIQIWVKLCQDYFTDVSFQKTSDFCENALMLFFQSNPNTKVTLKSGEWYDKKVSDILGRSRQNYVGFCTNFD